MANEVVDITKEKIQAYEDVRQSGVTNMFMVRTVVELSGLSRAEVLDIMKNYDKYVKQFNISRS